MLGHAEHGSSYLLALDPRNEFDYWDRYVLGTGATLPVTLTQGVDIPIERMRDLGARGLGRVARGQSKLLAGAAQRRAAVQERRRFPAHRRGAGEGGPALAIYSFMKALRSGVGIEWSR